MGMRVAFGKTIQNLEFIMYIMSVWLSARRGLSVYIPMSLLILSQRLLPYVVALIMTNCRLQSSPDEIWHDIAYVISV